MNSSKVVRGEEVERVGRTRFFWRGPALLTAAVVLLILVLMQGKDRWNYVGVAPLPPIFQDLAAVLAAGEAYQAGLDVYAPNPFDYYNRPHVYGPWWLVTGKLGLTGPDALWLGAVVDVLFIVTASLLLAPRNPTDGLMAFLLLASPPIMLAVERANNDLIVFLLLTAGVFLLQRPAWWRVWSGRASLILAAALKLYPIVALAAVGSGRGGRWRLLRAMMLCSLICVALFWLQRTSYERAFAIAPRPVTIFAYGAGLLGTIWASPLFAKGWLLAGAVAGLGLSGVLLLPLRKTWWHALPLRGWRTGLAVAGGFCWLACYVLSTNFPYRAVLLLLTVPWLLDLEAATPGRRAFGRRLGLLLLGCLWISAPKLWWAAMMFVSADDFERTHRWLALVVGLENAGLIALNVVLLACLAGWVVRWWKDAAAA